MWILLVIVVVERIEWVTRAGVPPAQVPHH
jgi:hypothetical protein